MKNLNWGLGIAMLLAASTAWGGQLVPISGTFQKGPANPARTKFNGPLPNVMQIRNETADGSVQGGAFTGSASYQNNEEAINLKQMSGTFHMIITIDTENGSVLTLGLDGKTSGFDPATFMVQVSGNWRVVSATGPDSGMHGEGTFSGSEFFVDGSTTGSFTGTVH
jgi:hypothetical protein